MNYNVIKKVFPLDNCNNIKNLKYDNEGLYSISHPESADTISKKIKLFEKSGINLQTIIDATAGLGGNTLSFAKYFDKVISIEIDEKRFNHLQDNVKCYKYENIILYNQDFFNVLSNLDHTVDAIFIDPPWGGPNYKYDDNLEIKLSEYDLSKVCKIINEYMYNNSKVKMIIFKLPYNYDINNILKDNKFIKYHVNFKDGNINYLIILINQTIEKEV